MIQRAKVKKARLRTADLTRFVISTVYGARRIELAELGENSFDLELKVLRIEPRKRGEPRTHIVPDEIIHWLRPKGLEPIDEGEMSKAFIRIENALGFNHQKGFGWHCVPPNTQLLTFGGHKSIASVEVGDLVSCGTKFTKVLEKFRHEYKGSLIEIKAYGILPFSVTPNHPILVGFSKFTRGRGRHRKIFKLKWIEARELGATQFKEKPYLYPTPWGYLAVPKFKPKISFQTIDLHPYVKKYGWGKLRHLRDGIRITPELAELFGRYVADGSGSKGQIQIDFNPHKPRELEALEKYAKIVKDDLGFSIRVNKIQTHGILRGKEVHGTALRMLFGGEVLHRILKDNFKINARNAWIPKQIISSSPNVVASFTRGYLGGDGYHAKYGFEVSSVCRGLILQLQHLLTSIGVFSSVRSSPSDLGRFHLQVKEGNLPLLGIDSSAGVSRGLPILEDTEYFYAPIKQVRPIPYEGEVFNIETGARCYTINNVLTHNSIRRRLATWFDDHDVSEKNVDSFMRWKRRKTTRARYVVRTPVETEKVQAEVDRKMFKLHPFLSSWTSTES